MAIAVASLEDIGAVLAEGGFDVAGRSFRSVESAVVAESPYAIVGCMEAGDWTTLRNNVADFQAELTHLTSRPGSARRWDLYVVVHVIRRSRGVSDDALVEAIEADTRYARKFVRIAIPHGDRAALERALRPLLPLQDAPSFDQFDPLLALREELRGLAVPDSLADAALTSFAATNEVSVP